MAAEIQKIGPYQITRLIGKGGMGRVYEAINEQIQRRVAIKILNSQFAANTIVVQRFLNEARAVNIVKHRCLVDIYEFGQLEDGSAYIVMEYLDGDTLHERLWREGGKLPVDVAIRCARQIALALAAAHAKDIIHRDLKPAQITSVEKPHIAVRNQSEKLRTRWTARDVDVAQAQDSLRQSFAVLLCRVFQIYFFIGIRCRFRFLCQELFARPWRRLRISLREKKRLRHEKTLLRLAAGQEPIHRVALSNARLLRVDAEQVRFHTRHGKPTKLVPEVFIGRFLSHVLPKGFVKIRHYGLMVSGHATTRLEVAHTLLTETAMPAAVPAISRPQTVPTAPAGPRAPAVTPELPS